MSSFKENLASTNEENLDIDAGGSLNDDELSFDQDSDDSEFSHEKDTDANDLDVDDAAEILSSKKAKPQPFSLQARRAIEDHLEQRRLRKELDYLYDEDFSNPEDPQK